MKLSPGGSQQMNECIRERVDPQLSCCRVASSSSSVIFLLFFFWGASESEVCVWLKNFEADRECVRMRMDY